MRRAPLVDSHSITRAITRLALPVMRLRRIHRPLLLGAFGAALAGCTDLNLTNPNQPDSENFWTSETAAMAGLNATYNGLLHNGTYGRWLVFAYDLRADDGMILSPWTDLSNFAKFTFVDYNFEVNREIWIHHYQAIFRANQVIANVPGIEMDAELRDRIVGEAKFIRALLYYNLVSLYGNVPLITAPPLPSDRPAAVPPEETWAQIEQDLEDAAAVLPESYTGSDIGRATSGAATALLAKAHLQQREWAEAATAFQDVIESGEYSLMPGPEGYAANFTAVDENNQESVFEVQFGDRSLLASGVRGLNISRMVGPCGPSFCDGRPTEWYYQQFLASRTTTDEVDPRLDATLYYPGGPDVYNIPYDTRYPASSTIFFKKYGEYYLGLEDQDWDAAINFRVIRYSDVLLGRAEAVNEAGSAPTQEVYDLVDEVRARVNLPPLATGLTKEEMREAILHERLLEFGLEGQRWNDLTRHDLLDDVVPADAGTAACTPMPTLAGCDAEFSFFVDDKSELLPIPQTERDLNPNVPQNPCW